MENDDMKDMTHAHGVKPQTQGGFDDMDPLQSE